MMTRTRARIARWSWALLPLLAGALIGCGDRHSSPPASPPKPQVEAGPARLSDEAVAQLAGEAFVFGYPLVLMDVTRAVMTATPKPDGKRAPANQFAHLRQFPDYTFTDVVSPNVDTLYSFAWLDLTHQPMLLSVPDAGNRYYLMPLLDAWTNVFASPGPRTTGTGKATFAITGPNWHEPLPDGVQEIKAPTNLVWLIGRVQTDGPKDYAQARAFQDKLRLTPFGAWGNTYIPPDNVPVTANIDTSKPPAEQVLKMDAATFFRRLNALMKDNPPARADAPALQRFTAIGVAPGAAFNTADLDPRLVAGIERGVAAARQKLLADARKPHGRDVNGWDVMTDLGNYGTAYEWRAIVALVGLGANLPEDAMYPRAITDGRGQPLSGAQHYVMRFARGQLPPVNAFWSLTVYNNNQALVQNPINRYAIGSRDALKFDGDGALTLYLQHDSPGKAREANWLPTPAGPFNLALRLYWPKPQVLQGRWQIPPVEPAPSPAPLK